jgi:hypothetical protein
MSTTNRRGCLGLILLVGTATFTQKHWAPFLEQWYAYDQIKPLKRWSSEELFAFITSLPPEQAATIKKSLNLPESEPLTFLKLKWTLSDLSGHTLVNWGRRIVSTFDGSVPEVDYHEKLAWTAKEMRISADAKSSFAVERKICEAVFAEAWNKLSADERRKYLDEVEIGKPGAVRAGLIALDGADLLINGVELGVQRFGFQFYVRMSQLICHVGRLFGATIPFFVYTTASTVIKFLSGPWGWAISGLIAVIQYGVFGFPSAKNLTPFILAVHTLKAARLEEAGVLESVGKQLKV